MTEQPQAPTPGGVFPLAGRPTPRVGYGMGRLTRAVSSTHTRAAAVTLLHQAFEFGIRHFDTAQFYGNGTANELLREAFRSRRDEVLLATKAGARPVPDAPVPLTAAQRPEELRAAVEANLATLDTDRVDVVYLRRMDFAPGLLAEGDQIVPLADQLAELVALRDAGKIVAIGLSHITLDQFRAAAPAGIGCVQNIYHLLDRDAEPLLNTCRDHDVAWIPYFPLGGGGAYAGLADVTADPAVEEIARELGATPTQVGLAWQLTHAPNTMLIPGTAGLDHLGENVAAGSIELDAAAMRRLDALGDPGR
nr:aldo/keto reductase [Nocardia nova]